MIHLCITVFFHFHMKFGKIDLLLFICYNLSDLLYEIQKCWKEERIIMDDSRYNPAVQKWIHMMADNATSNGELTLKYCNDIIEYAQENTDDALAALGYYYCGVVYYISNEGGLFYEAVTKSLSCASKVEEWELMARCYNFLGISMVNRGNAVVGLDYYISAINCCRKAGIESFQSTVLINIGALHIMYSRYDDAIENLQMAMDYFSRHPEHPRYDRYMICIYLNMAKAYLSKGMLIEAKCCFENLNAEHKYALDSDLQIVLWALEAMCCHIADEDEKCENRIACIDKEIKEHMSLMDIFEDIYDYCRVLLDRDRKEEFWRLISVLEPMVMSVGITNLVLRILSLKLKFYRKNEMDSEYMETAGKYYEISERIEVENNVMMNNVLNIRKNLEKVHLEKEEIEKQNQLLQQKSETDALTGLNNRFRLDDYAEELFERAIEHEIPLAIELLDIDCFKEYNDCYGHQKGDECISKIASAIKSMEEYGAFTARYGGDEFVIIYEDTEKSKVIEYMAELRKRVMELAIEHRNSKIARVATISQGLCWDIPVQGNTIKDYVHTADNMLYRVKQRKRNNFCACNLLQSGDQIVMSYL